jgi:hypothetical protein
MSENGFLRQEATAEIIKNVASFCSECYHPVLEKETIFYDMHRFRYLCTECQEVLDIQLKEESLKLLDQNNHGLFS